jgi:adenylate cyclase
MGGADAFEGEPDLNNDNKPAAVKKKSGIFSDRLRHRLRTIGAAAASVAAVGAVGSGLLGYWNIWKTVTTEIFHEGQSPQQYAATRPDVTPRLSLVVLPFANLNNDPDQDYFADGITTDLTTDLGRMPGAFVIGRGTAFAYKNKTVDLKILGKELKIRWAVQGAVQRSGDDVRINVALTDLSTGGDLWSDRFAGARANLADLQDQIVARLARSLSIELIRAESRRGSSKPDAGDFAMRGWAVFYGQQTQAQVRKASELFDEALRLDPNDVDAMLGKSWCLSINALFQWSASPEGDLSKANELVDRAFARGPPSALAHVVRGHALVSVMRRQRLPSTMRRCNSIQTIPPPIFSKGSNLQSLDGHGRPSLPIKSRFASAQKTRSPLACTMASVTPTRMFASTLRRSMNVDALST